MQVQLFSIPVWGGDLATEELNRFLRTHRILSLDKRLVERDGECCWAFCIQYLERAFGSEGEAMRLGAPRVDYKEVLSAADFAVCVRLRDARKNRVRLGRRWRRLERQFSASELSERGFQARSTALFAFTRHAECKDSRRRLFSPTIRSAAIGHEPGVPGRQLEQQRQQRPLREPQQQHGLPPRPQLRPDVLESTDEHGTEPAAVLLPHQRDKLATTVRCW